MLWVCFYVSAFIFFGSAFIDCTVGVHTLIMLVFGTYMVGFLGIAIAEHKNSKNKYK
jgi:hypothetical protein